MSLTTRTLYLSVDQIAERFNVSKDTIWRWRRKGEFPAPFKLGGKTTRWRLSDVEEWEEQLECGFVFFLDHEPVGLSGERSAPQVS